MAKASTGPGGKELEGVRVKKKIARERVRKEGTLSARLRTEAPEKNPSAKKKSHPREKSFVNSHARKTGPGGAVRKREERDEGTPIKR